jgi:hypothetical protein
MKLIKENFLIVSDYNWLPQNIDDSWVSKYAENYLIYDRAHRWNETSHIKRQKNVGQNIYDMLDFIVTHYDCLPSVMIFCRAAFIFPKGREKPLSNGNCSESIFLELSNNKNFTELHDYGHEVHDGCSSKMDVDGGFLELNNSWYFYSHPGRYFKSQNDFLKDVFINPAIPEYIRFSPGANYVIPRSNILKYEKYFYERLREYVGWGIVTGEAHMIERCIYTIFTCNYIVKDKYKIRSPFKKNLDLFIKRIYVFLWNIFIPKLRRIKLFIKSIN